MQRHNSVHFFELQMSRKNSKPKFLATFDLEMCLAPQWHAMCQHFNCQNASARNIFATIDANMFFAHKSVHAFSPSQFQRCCQIYVLYNLFFLNINNAFIYFHMFIPFYLLSYLCFDLCTRI